MKLRWWVFGAVAVVGTGTYFSEETTEGTEPFEVHEESEEPASIAPSEEEEQEELVTVDATVEPEPTETPSANEEPTTPEPSVNPADIDGLLAIEVVETLEVKGRAPKTGYDRDLFGQRWADIDRNGCDTRNDILSRDLTDKTFKPGTRDCVVGGVK